MLTRRQLALLMNALAVLTDKLAEDNKGQFPDSSRYDAAQQATELVQECYQAQPYLTFGELNELLNAMLLIVSGQYNELAQLPPTQIQ